jgi:tetratricopeptide (TPR) repeat protein
MNHRVEELDDIPLLMIEKPEKKQRLLNYLNAFNFPNDIKNYLGMRLNLKINGMETEAEKHFEEYARDYMNHLLCGELDKALLMYSPAIIGNETNFNLLIQHFKGHHAVRKLKEFDLISSGFSPQTQEAFVSFEINKNQEFTLILAKNIDRWVVSNQVFGAINLVRTENEALRFIAASLAEQNFEKAYKYISNYKQIYFYSADLYYYEGLFFSLKGDNGNAAKSYELAIALDPLFIESYHNLAFIMQAESKIDKAKALYEKIIQIQPDYLNALNNLGTISLYEKDVDKAEAYFKKCLEYDPNFDYAVKNIEKINEIREGKIKI